MPSNRRRNSHEYEIDYRAYANTSTQYPNIAEEEVDSDNQYYTNAGEHYNYEPTQAHQNANTGFTSIYDQPSTQGYAANSQQPRSVAYEEPTAYQQSPYQQQQPPYQQQPSYQHQPPHHHQPSYQQQSTYGQHAIDQQWSLPQQQAPYYQPTAEQYPSIGEHQPTGHNEADRQTESSTTQQIGPFESPAATDSPTPTPRTWTNSSLEVNVPESVTETQGPDEMASSGSHEYYPPSPESYAHDDPAEAGDPDRTGDFVADRQSSFERHQEYAYAPDRAQVRHVVARRQDIREVDVAHGRAVRDNQRNRVIGVPRPDRGGSGKGKGSN